jgi:hypothetical protein
MKHPEHSSAKNEYANRSTMRLPKSSKRELAERMKAFNLRVQEISERLNIN